MSEQIDTHLERAIEEARGLVTERPAPDLTAQVMRRIEELGVAPAQPSIWSRLTGFIWRPRRVEFEWRPAYALIGAAAVLLLIAFLPYRWRTPAVAAPFRAAVDITDPRLFVQFHLDA